MKKLAIMIISLWFGTAQAAQFGSLVANHEFNLYQDAQLIETAISYDSQITFDLPTGKHTIEIVDMGPAPTATPTEVQTEDPTPSPTPSPTDPIIDPPTGTPTATATPSPSPSPTVEPTLTEEEGLEVFVASYDENTQRNRFQIMDISGKSLTSYTEVLEGVPSEGQMRVADLNGDGVKEIIAFGASIEGILLEYWNGAGQMIQSRTTLTSWHHFDIHLQTCDFDGNPGEEVIVMGRNQSGIYRFEVYDSNGASVVTFPSIVLGYNTIQGFAMDDVDGDGETEVVVFGRTSQDRIEATVIGIEGVDAPVTLFGQGYMVSGNGFTVDIDGDGRLRDRFGGAERSQFLPVDRDRHLRSDPPQEECALLQVRQSGHRLRRGCEAEMAAKRS